ncbi:MAG: glycosyltransferase family 4 protein [Nitrospirae bacterium]|nr:glycosyltransferase family 4 protein [Nitrospirota bacterium]
MKIAILRKKYTFHGGAESFSGSFIEKLADDGHEIHIFAIKWKAAGVHKNIHFHRIPAVTFNSFLRDLTFALSSYYILKKQRKSFDIIQTHDKTLYQDIYRAGDGCHIEWLRQRWKRIGLSGKISIMLNPYHWLILSLERSIFNGRRFEKVIAISELVKKNITDNYKVSPSDIEVIYNGVDTVKFHPENREKYRSEIRRKHGLADNDFVVLFMGSGFERKGVGYLLQAVEAMDEPVAVLVVGKGSEKKFRKISTSRCNASRQREPSPSFPKRGNTPLHPSQEGNNFPLWKRGIKGDFQFRQNILFCGPQKDNYKYYAAADIFVFPTIYEPFGNVHLEALASGLPVITTANSGAAEIIKDDVQGFVIREPEDFRAIAEKIRIFVNDRSRLSSMSENARQSAEEFTFERHIGKIKELYEKVVDERSNK